MSLRGAASGETHIGLARVRAATLQGIAPPPGGETEMPSYP